MILDEAELQKLPFKFVYFGNSTLYKQRIRCEIDLKMKSYFEYWSHKRDFISQFFFIYYAKKLLYFMKSADKNVKVKNIN